jgi:hypothetical protein
VDILTLVRIFFRRWYVSVPISVAACLFALYVQSTVPPAYEASGSVLFEHPEFDPSRLPITMVDLDAIADSVTDELDDDLLIRVRGSTSVEVIAVADTGVQAENLAAEALDRLESAVTAVQVEGGVDEPDRVALISDRGIGEAEDLVDGRFQVGALATLDDPAARTPNPYPAGGTTAQLLEVAVSSDVARTQIGEQQGPGVSFAVASSTRDGSIMQITTVGPDAADVLAAFWPVLDALSAELEARQDRAEVPRSRHIRLAVLAAPGQVTDVSPPLDRSVAAIFALGGLLALGAAVVVESIASRRRLATLDTPDETGWLRRVEREFEAPAPEDQPPDPASWPTAPGERG